MADSVSLEERDDDSQGGNSDDEIAELRIQALLTKKVNEAEVSPARDPPQSSSYKNINKSHHNDRNRSFRQPHGNGHGNPIGRIPVVGASNYMVDLTPSHLDSGYGPHYHSNADGAKNFRRKGNYIPGGPRRGRGQGRYVSRGNEGNYNNCYLNPPPAKTQSPSLVLPQDKYSNTQPEQNKPKEKMSARWLRMQGSDSESDSEDTESDSSDTSSDSSGSSSTSSGSSSGSESDSDDSSVRKHKVVKDGKKDLPPVDAKSSGPSAGNSLQRQHSNKGTVSKSPPKQITAHGKAASIQKGAGLSRRNSVSPPSKKYSGSQLPKQSPKHLPRRLSTSPSNHKPFSSSTRPRSPHQRQGSRSPVRVGGRSPLPRNRSARSRSITPLRKRIRSSRSPLPWNRGRSPLPRRRSRTPLQRRVSPRLGSRSPLPKRSLSPRLRRNSRSSPVRRDASHSLSRKPPLGRRSSRSPIGRSSRSPLRRSSRSPLRRGSRSPLGRTTRIGRSSRSPIGSQLRGVGRRISRSPFGRRGSRSPIRRRGSLSPLPRRGTRSPIHRRNSRSPLPIKGSRSSLPRGSRSPLSKRGPGSFLPRSRSSRSPILKRSSRSPLPRRGSRSPLISPRSRRSPLPRRSSKSPLRRGSRSPILRRGTRSPLRRQSSRSPIRRQGSRSPFHRRGSRSSLHRQSSRSPRPGRISKSSVPPRGSRSPISRLHSRSPLPPQVSRSPYRDLAKIPGEGGRIISEPGRKRGLSRSRSPPPWRSSRSPLARKSSRSPLHRSSRSPLGGRIARSPHKLGKGSPQKVSKTSPSGRSIRSPPLQRISKSPLPRRLSRSPKRTRSPASRRLTRSPLLRSSRSPVSRMLSSPRHRTRSPALRRISRSPLPHQLSRSPLPPRRPRNMSPHHGDKSPSPKRLPRLSPSSHRSYSPSRRIQRFSQSPVSPRNFGSRNQTFRSHSPGVRRGPGLSVRSHSPLGRSPSPGGRREWGHGRRSRSPGAYRAGSPYEINSRSLSPHRIGRGNSPLRERNQRLANRGSRGGFNRQGFDRAADNAHTRAADNAHANHRFPQGNALAAAGRLEFPPGYNGYNMNNNNQRLDYNEVDPNLPGRSAWPQGGRRDDRDQFSPHRMVEGTWQGQYPQRDRPGPLLYAHPEAQFDNRGHSHMPVLGLQVPGLLGGRGRGRGIDPSPKPLLYRSISPPPLAERSPPRFHSSGRYGDMPPQGQNDRRRRFSPNRLPPRTNERSRSNSPYSAGSQLHMQGGRGRPLSPREQVRRGPRTPPIPSNRKLSPRQSSLWPDEKGSVQGNRGSPTFAHDRMPAAGGSNQNNSERYAQRNNSPTNAREPYRSRDLASHQQQFPPGRSHSPGFERRQDAGDIRDRLGRDAASHVSHDRKKRRMQSPQKSENRSRGNSASGRGRGRGNRGRRPLSPSDRSRRQLGQGTDTSVQQHPRSPSSHQKGVSSGNGKGSSHPGKVNPKFGDHSPERQGRNGSPWLEPVTPEKQAHGGGDRSISPPTSVGEPQKSRTSKQEPKPVEKSKENERRPRTNNKPKEEVPSSKGKRDSSKRNESTKTPESQSKKVEESAQVPPLEESKKVSLKPKEEHRTFKSKSGKEKEEREEDIDDKKKKRKKKKYRKLSREEGEEDSDDDISVKSKSSKKKKKEKKKKKDSKKKKKKHKKADSDSEEAEPPRSKGQKDGKRDAGDMLDLRHTLKRKLDSTGEKGSVRSDGNKKEDKPQRKDRDEDSKDSKSRLGDDSSRKKRQDGKPILVTVRSGEDRKVTSGKPAEKRGGDNSTSLRVSVHERLGPAKSSWDGNKSSRGSGGSGGGSSGSSRQKRGGGDKSKAHHQSGGGGTTNSSSSSSSRLKLRR